MYASQSQTWQIFILEVYCLNDTMIHGHKNRHKVTGIFITSMHLPIQEKNSSCIQVLYPNKDTLADLMVRSRVIPHTTHFLQVSFKYTQLKIIKYMIKRAAKHWKIYIPVDKRYSTTVEAGSISYPDSVWMFDVQKCIFNNSVVLNVSTHVTLFFL